MRDPLAATVHSILHYGLSLRERLEGGASLPPEAQRRVLVEMLTPLATEEIWDAGEEEGFDFDFSEGIHQEVRDQMSQATIRYALICWLDELLLCYTPWAECWREQTLEAALLGSQQRRQKFWEEARYAEVRNDGAALEVMYWCVLLGYRGPWRDRPDLIESWAARMRQRLEKPAERMPAVRSEEPPAEAAASDLPYQRMLFSALVTVSLLVPGALLIYWRHLSPV